MEAAKTKRAPRATGMAWLTPALTVHDVDKEISFCGRAFGLEKEMTMADKEGTTVHGALKYEGETIVMFGREGAMGCPSKSPATSKADCPISLYVYCPDIDALYRRAKAAGATVVSEPADMFWGDRVATFKALRDTPGCSPQTWANSTRQKLQNKAITSAVSKKIV